ncbi:MAG: hypothetical protein RL095_657 [Verrucomicrobiota bacterium]|jgi:SEC-C motif-containing protein
MNPVDLCPCGSCRKEAVCCNPFLDGSRLPATAEELMRSRYTAYTRADAQYLIATLHPSQRSADDEANILAWAHGSRFTGLSVLKTKAGKAKDSEGVVEFVARFSDADGTYAHRETSRFVKEDGKWWYVSAL